MAALVSFDRPALSASSTQCLPVCFRPTHPALLQALASSCVAATSWLPPTCKLPSTLPTNGGSTVPVSRPIACALPVPLSLCRIGSFLRQAEHVGPALYCYTLMPLVVRCTNPSWFLWKVADSNRLLILSSSGNTAVARTRRSVVVGRCARLLAIPLISNFAGLLHCFRLFPSVFLALCGSPAPAPCGSPARNQSIFPLSTIL